MPTKFKPSQTTVERGTSKKTTTHFYMKSMPKAELIDKLDNSNTRPKDKQKIRNELVRRSHA